MTDRNLPLATLIALFILTCSGAAKAMNPSTVQLPFNQSRAVFYDNDDHRDVYTDELLMALAHLEWIDLKGIVTTYAANEREWKMFVPGRAEIADLARRSGLRNIPDPRAGTDRRLAMPESKRVDDTAPLNLPAAQDIVRAALAATPEKPLVIICGGQLTTVADAVLQAPEIADRIVVAGLFGASTRDYNAGLDSWAWTVLLAKCRVFAVPFGKPGNRGTVFLKGARTGKQRILEHLPQQVPLFKWMYEKRHPGHGGPGDFDGDGHALIALLNPDYITAVQRYRFSGVDEKGMPVLVADADGPIYEALDADADAATETFWSAFDAVKQDLGLPGNSRAPAEPSGLIAAADKRTLVHRDTGQPFLWIGDTAWSAIKQLRRAEMDAYLDLRREQGFTVVQVILIGHDPGPNIDGHFPFEGDWDATRPRVRAGAEDWWDRADYFIDGAIARGMYVVALPLWRKHVHEQPLIGKDETYLYGKWLGERYGDRNGHIIWCLGGDMYLDYKHYHDASYDVFHNLARGLAVGVTGAEDYAQMCMTYHIWGGNSTAKVPQLKDAPWMTFHTIQSGHKEDRQEGMLRATLELEPDKPAIDIEPMYDDFQGAHIDRTRHINYWGVLEGGFGTTMGSWNVWHFGERGWDEEKNAWDPPQSYATGFAGQIRHLGALLSSRPMLGREFAPEILHPDSRHSGRDRIYANRLGDGASILIYTPRGASFRADLGQLTGSEVRVWWFNPRDGSFVDGGRMGNEGGYVEFDPPGPIGKAFGTADWVLVLDDAVMGYGPPGQ